MTIAEFESADSVLTQVMESVRWAIHSHESYEAPSEVDGDAWAAAWLDTHNKLQAGYRLACQQRMDLVRDFKAKALGLAAATQSEEVAGE